MKKIILVLLVLVSVGCSLFALDVGAIYGGAIGYNSIYNSVNVVSSTKGAVGVDLGDTIDLDLLLGFRVSNFRVIGSYKNTLRFAEWDTYIPLQDIFTIELTYTIGDIVLGFSHYCIHPVDSFKISEDILLYGAKRSVYIKWYTER